MFTFTFLKKKSMLAILPLLLIFIIALAIGIFIGKLIFSARFQSEKISLPIKPPNANAIMKTNNKGRIANIDFYFLKK